MVEYLRVFDHVGFFCSWRHETFVTKGEETLAGAVPVGKKANPCLSGRAFVLIAALGVLTIGCDCMTGTTQNKTETKTTQTKDGKTTGKTTTSTDTKTKTTTPTAGGMTTETTK